MILFKLKGQKNRRCPEFYMQDRLACKVYQLTSGIVGTLMALLRTYRSGALTESCV